MNSLEPFIRHELENQPGTAAAPQASSTRNAPPLGSMPLQPPAAPDTPGTQLPPPELPQPEKPGVPMTDGTPMACRQKETMALEQGFFSGVDFIASIHAPDAAQAQCRPQVQALLQRGMLRQLVILAGRETPGCIREVCAV